MKQILRFQILILLVLSTITSHTFASSGGPLSPEQAAYNVNYYDLDILINPETLTIEGSLLCRVFIVNSIDTLVFDLDDPFLIDSVIIKINEGSFTQATYNRTELQIKIHIPVAVTSDDIVTTQIFYNGAPRIANNPPWGVGFVWEQTPDGDPWLGVTCEDEGADIWWPCKDHPSDEPDSMRMSFTVPDPLFCASNGQYMGSIANDDNTTTYNWFISTPINNYNVTFYAAEFLLIEDNYYSIIGDSIPFYFWVLPEYYNTAVNYMDVFLTEFDFLESICGPFPFGDDKHGWAHASYWGMEHQTIIAYGHNFTVNNWGFDYIHYHELAHEWYGNLVTAADFADIWIHEGMATYTEALYVEYLSGMDHYHQYMDNTRPYNNHSHPLAPREELTASEAFDNLNPYRRGASVMHTLRYHLGDDAFFNLFKRWAYPDSTDFDNTNGRLCRIVSTDDMKILAEEITERDLDPFFEVFFREAAYPLLNVVREIDSATFSWETETNVLLDLNIPIVVNGNNYIVEMIDGHGSFTVSINDDLEIDPKQWILMADPSIITSINGELVQNIDYQLEQNYPNPFKNKTQIKFSIPHKQYVTLSVFDVYGNEIKTLVDGKKSHGDYKVNFNASKLKAGTYFYRLQAGNYTETKRLIITK